MTCKKCNGNGTIYVKERTVQGQDYGPEEIGHCVVCLECKGTGQISATVQTQSAFAASFGEYCYRRANTIVRGPMGEPWPFIDFD